MGQKHILRILDDLSPSDLKLKDLPRLANSIYNMSFNEFGQLVKRKGFAEYNTASIKVTSTTVDATSNAGQKVLSIAVTTGLVATESVMINEGEATEETGVIASVAGGVSITLVSNLTYQHVATEVVIGMNKISGMHRYYKQDPTDKEFLVACDTKWWKIASAAGHAATALLADVTPTPFTTTTDMQTFWTNFKNRCYGVNTKGLWKYNGSYVRTVGITPPTLAPTGTSPATGYLSEGNYKVIYTYVDEDGFESNGSPASENIACSTDDKITLAIVVSDDKKVDRRRIYRTAVNDTAYYFDKEVDDNVAITVDLTQADSDLVEKSILHTDHDVPPTTPHLIEKRRSRIMLADGEDLYVGKMTSEGDEYFPTDLYFTSGNKQKITGIKEQITTLPVFTDDSLERFTGFSSQNFQFKNAFSNEGCVAPRSLANCKNMLVYLGYNGIYYYDGTTGRMLDEKLSKDIMDNINPTYMHLSCGVYFEDKYFLTYPKGDSTVPNETVYFDIGTKTTGVYNLGFSCYSVWDKGGDAYSLKGGSNTEGRIYSVFDGLTDDGAAIACHDDVQGIDLGLPDIYKKWYGIFVKVKTTAEDIGEDTLTLKMYHTIDSEDEAFVSETLTPDTTQWYYIQFGSNSLLARSLAYRPYMFDKYDVTIMGYALVYSLEPPKWRK